MKITPQIIKIKDLVKGYVNNEEEGVFGYGGILNIRPAYQRLFVYESKDQVSVINTVMNKYPLNVMYWVKNKDGQYEVLDGQQRIMSICNYFANKFMVDDKYYHSLTDSELEKFLNYELSVYFCEGSYDDKINWFETINIAGKSLTPQELKNAIYSGSWITDAKRYFSKSDAPVKDDIYKKYLKGEMKRQVYLETAIKWISGNKIKEYMSKNQHKEDASGLWLYFQGVINWVTSKFINHRDEMKGVDWGKLYKEYKDQDLSPSSIEEETKTLMMDPFVTNNKGVYEYILSRNTKHLHVRVFNDKQKRIAFEKQNGICRLCGPDKKHKLKEMEADHVEAWSKGGATDQDNCEMLCIRHNREKGNK